MRGGDVAARCVYTLGSSRHIPASVKRDVWRRDEGRCAYVGREGRCTERGFLEYHHVRPHGGWCSGNGESREKQRTGDPM